MRVSSVRRRLTDESGLCGKGNSKYEETDSFIAYALSQSIPCGLQRRREEDRDAVLTITKADGTEETMTSDELMDIYDENEINYNDNYMGCEATVEGYVLDVEQGSREIFDNIWADTAEIFSRRI